MFMPKAVSVFKYNVRRLMKKSDIFDKELYVSKY